MGDNVGLSHIYTKNPYNYRRSPVMRPIVIRLVGRSLVWVEGEKEHKRMRSLIAPAFSSDSVRAMHGDVYYVSSALQARIANEIHASGKSSVQLNILDYTALATLDIIGRVAFGHDFNAVGDAPDAIKVINTMRAQHEAGCEPAAFTALLILRLFPWIISLPLKAIQAQSAVADTIRKLAKDIVANSQVDDKGDRKDLMSLMLQANACQDESKRCDITEIYEHIVTLVYVFSCCFCFCCIRATLIVIFYTALPVMIRCLQRLLSPFGLSRKTLTFRASSAKKSGPSLASRPMTTLSTPTSFPTSIPCARRPCACSLLHPVMRKPSRRTM